MTAYWLVIFATLASLLAVHASVSKVAVLAASSAFAAGRPRSMAGPFLLIALVLPEAGGARPAVLAIVALVLWPLVLRSLTACRFRETIGYRPVQALIGLGLAGAAAAVVGLAVRGASLQAVMYDAVQRSLPMTAFLVFMVLPAAERTLDDPQGGDEYGVRARGLAFWLVAGGLVAALVGIAQVTWGYHATDRIAAASAAIGYAARTADSIGQDLWWGVRKAFAGYFSPNGLGAALMFVLLVSAAGAADRRTSQLRSLAAACVLSGALILTFSRASLLAAAAGLLALAWSRRLDRPRFAAVCVGGALVLPALHILLLATPDALIASGTGGAGIAWEIKSRTAFTKIEEVRAALSMFASGSWAGSGYGVVYDIGRGFTPAARAIGMSPAYAEIVYRSGVIGLAALLFAGITFFRLWRRTSAIAREQSPQLRWWRCGIGGALVLSFIDHPFLTVPGLSAVFWAAWGMLARVDRERHRDGS